MEKTWYEIVKKEKIVKILVIEAFDEDEDVKKEGPILVIEAFDEEDVKKEGAILVKEAFDEEEEEVKKEATSSGFLHYILIHFFITTHNILIIYS